MTWGDVKPVLLSLVLYISSFFNCPGQKKKKKSSPDSIVLLGRQLIPSSQLPPK